MANPKLRISDTVAEKAEVTGKRYTIADTDISGFWLVVSSTGKKSFVLRYRVGGGRSGTVRELKIGDWPAMKASKARSIASEWHAEVRLGGDPGGARQAQRVAPTMNDLFDRYLKDHARPTKKASSLVEDEQLLRDYLRPAFGGRKVHDLNRGEVDRFHKGLVAKPTRANRALALLSKAMNLAEAWGLRQGGTNPVRHVTKFKEKSRQRYLSQDEIERLGAVMRDAEDVGYLVVPGHKNARRGSNEVHINPYAIWAIRLLILTGARKSEILSLQWDWIDEASGCAYLPDSKSGAKPLVLSPAAMEQLARIPRKVDNAHVIAGGKPGAALVNLKDAWSAIHVAAGIEDVHLHDLRHSFASVAAGQGFSLHIIGGLLGHSQPKTTARYAHLANAPLREASARISDGIVSLMG